MIDYLACMQTLPLPQLTNYFIKVPNNNYFAGLWTGLPKQNCCKMLKSLLVNKVPEYIQEATANGSEMEEPTSASTTAGINSIFFG